MKKTVFNPALNRAAAILIGTLVGISGVVHASVDISSSPLHGGKDVPGNLAILASVEFPTLISVANLADTYTPGVRYVGYFDSNKCYKYHYSPQES
ncbi:hypothetical protein, partial [Xylella fastidiosa]